jgi:phage FluMu gp28-like protein
VGVDLGQKKDHTAIAVVEKRDREYTLVHLKQFALGTEYTQVVDYLKLVADGFHSVNSYYIDQTGVGEFFVENARKRGLKNVKGIVLTMPGKQDVMTCLKQVMEENRLHIPKDSGLMNEMSNQMAEVTSTGRTKFYHRSGTHDDRLWALALAIYAGRHDIERYHPVVMLGTRPNRFSSRPVGVQWLRQITQNIPVSRTNSIEWCYACNHAKVPGTQHTCPGQLPR